MITLRRESQRVETEIARLEVQRDLLTTLKGAALPEGAVVRDREGKSLTDAILSTIGANPDMTSGAVALYMIQTTDWAERTGSKDFVKTVQTLIGQLVRSGRIEKADDGGLTLHVLA